MAALALALLAPPAYATGADPGVTGWHLAPGVDLTAWTEQTPTGPIRVHLLDVDPAQPGVALAYGEGRHLRDRATVSRRVATDGALAGVNGNYYDISDTGAPLGIGVDRGRGLLHAPVSGWNTALYEDSTGLHVGDLPLAISVPEHPSWPVSSLDTPHVRPGGIGVYTPVWGDADGPGVVDGDRHVREVRVRHGVVVANTRHLSRRGPVVGLVLVGRGAGADALRQARVGSPLRVRRHLDHDPVFAITGSQRLLDRGRVVAHRDGQHAPRTAVGLDHANGHVLVVVVDGRQDDSRGLSLPDLALLLRRLGADDAINLDGGGSTTMVAGGTLVNHPSTGVERKVADALEVTYTP